MANSETYNDVPEIRGTPRNKGTFDGMTEKDRQDAERLAAFMASLEDDER